MEFPESTDWHLPSPSSTPKSVTFPDSTFKTPKAEAPSQSHFLDAWSTPRVNGQQTPAQTPSFTFTTPIERPSSSYSHTQKPHTPEDPEFHVNHFVPNNLPLPPVDPSRRLSSSPDPSKHPQATPRQKPPQRPRPVSMDTSQMQTPPPTRDATSRRGMHQQHVGNNFATPATVIHRTPGQLQPSDGLFNQTPIGFPALQFSPDMIQFPSAGPMSAPAMPQSRLFWDNNDPNQMEVDMPIASDPFGPTPHKIEDNLSWQTFNTPLPANHMNPQAFQALHGLSSPGPVSSFASNTAPDNSNSRPNSFISTSGGVDPSMLFSFSSPGPNASFSHPMQQISIVQDTRQPYETQMRDSMREREMAKKAKSQHSRTSTSSSTASFEARPSLQRSNTDSGFRKSRPSSMESRTSGGAAPPFNIPRRSSPLKRQSGASLMSIPEVRRPRTRLVIDADGRARTETVAPEDDVDSGRDSRRSSQKDMRQQYPGLWADDDSESESEESATLSRNASFSMPQRRSSKHARADSGGLERSNSFKMARPSSGIFDKSSFETIRPIKKAADNPFRRFSMMDLPTSFTELKDSEDQQMPDSPGDALGALKKVVEGRQKRIERSSQNTLKAHNQRWAQASADIANASPHGMYDPYTNSFSASPANSNDAGLTTPSTDRSSLSSESTRCLCNASDDGRPMIQCESCNKWLHMACVGLNSQNVPPVYVCVFCTGTTPIARGGRVRGPIPFDHSPLTHKSLFRRQ